ncbi:hypothetical protein GCM10028805_09640 [Spirosoma harenae]
MSYAIRLFVFLLLLTPATRAQVPKSPSLRGYFLVDSIEIGRPFHYSLTYRHAASKDVLFPDTARQFDPYRVQQVAVFATRTAGTGPSAISVDSAVYTLISFETDTIQRLQVPVRIINNTDCTAQWTGIDSVFLRSTLPMNSLDSSRLQRPKLATDTQLASLKQQFNYLALAVVFLLGGLAALIVYALFGRLIRRQWKLYQLKSRHIRFLKEYNRLSRNINSYTAADVANQAVIIWKTYLESLDSQPYASMTTSELAEHMGSEHITDALREADRMIYGGAFSPQSQPSLRLLSEVATQAYHRCRDRLRTIATPTESTTSEPTETHSIS